MKDSVGLLSRTVNIPLRVKGFATQVRYHDALERSAGLNNLERGNRCVIVGGGPSFADVDKTMLENETVIMVNMSYRSDYYSLIRPEYHIAIDGGMLSGSEGEVFKSVMIDHPNTKYIVGVRGVELFGRLPNVFFVNNILQPTRPFKVRKLNKVNYTFVNVIGFAINVALSLGFEQIVLLGCDFNQFTSETDSHYYDEGSVCFRRDSSTLWQDLIGHGIVVLQHDILHDYSISSGIAIRNATTKSLLDSYPRIELVDALQG